MKKLAENPFKFGNPVEGDHYYPRLELTRTIKQFLSNHIHVVIMGPRRFGKTSFVIDLFHQLEKQNYRCLLIDIFNVTSHRDFLHQFLRAIRKQKRFKDSLRQFWKKFKQLTPQLNLGLDPQTGHLNSSVGVNLGELSEEGVRNGIQDLLEGLSDLGENVVIALDEFQQISQIEDKGWLEATIRTHLQKLPNVSFLFTGSQKSLISEMLNDPARPLYRSCQTMEFPSFGPDFSNWVMSRFQSVGIDCNINAINHLRKLVQDTPNYVQMVCFHLVALACLKINTSAVEKALKTVAKQNAYAYQTLLNSLSLPQKRTLRLAANETHSLFQKERITKYEIASAPALHNSIKALKTKGILDEEGTAKGCVLFDDPLFAYWLRITFPMEC